MKARMITDSGLIDEVIASCQVCYVGMIDEHNMPYTLGFNFGYVDKVLYLHAGPTGAKIDILKNNPNVCIMMSTDHQMYHQSQNVACSYGMKYKSVMIRGKVEFIEDTEQKVHALSQVMRQYTNREDYRYSMPSIKNVTVMRIVPDKVECKYFGY